MSVGNRKVFFEALGQHLVPRLYAEGFSGSGQTYRRFRDPVIQVIYIQPSKYGGECCVNMGIHLYFLPTVVGTPPDPGTLAQPECEFRRRLAPDGQPDYWWDFGSDEAAARRSAIRLVELLRERGLPYLNEWSAFPGHFTRISVDDLERGRMHALPGGHMTAVRAALAMARIHAHLNQPELVLGFAAFGLKNLGRATAPQTEFRRLLDDATAAG